MNKEIKWYGGIDPGEYGCFAFYLPVQPGVDKSELHFIDLKISKVSNTKGERDGLHQSFSALAEAVKVFTEITGKPVLTLVETPHSMPSDGHVGAFTFGKACGLIVGMLHGVGLPQYEAIPSVWKAQLGLTRAQKKGSIAKAQELFAKTHIPQGHEMFVKPVRHSDGRAEAALLAWLAAHKMGRIPYSENT